MKLFFSLALLFSCFTLQARPIVLIEYELNLGLAKQVRKITEERIGIPDFFITLQKVARLPCVPRFESIIHICVDNFGQIYFPVLKKDVLERTFVPMIKQQEGSL